MHPEDVCLLPQVKEVLKGRSANYEIIKFVGKGGFGVVYEAKRLSDNEIVAVKCELRKMRHERKTLLMETMVLVKAKSMETKHFVEFIEKGSVTARFNFVVMTMLGQNLSELRIARRSRQFSLSTSLKLASQTLKAIEQLHDAGFLHRDIKPGNFAIGRRGTQDEHTAFILDFGLARRYRQREKDLRLPRKKVKFLGTTRYASIAALLREDLSKKDDIESWYYMIMEWMIGKLPWGKIDDKEEVLRRKKELRENSKLEMFLKNCPIKQFRAIFRHFTSLKYYSIPDYNYIQKCLKNSAKANKISTNQPLDWDPKNPYHGPKY